MSAILIHLKINRALIMNINTRIKKSNSGVCFSSFIKTIPQYNVIVPVIIALISILLLIVLPVWVQFLLNSNYHNQYYYSHYYFVEVLE
jgi:hypothetical protein